MAMLTLHTLQLPAKAAEVSFLFNLLTLGTNKESNRLGSLLGKLPR
jgi:hypothetical protein